MIITITFDLPATLTGQDIDTFQEAIQSEAYQAVERIYEYHGKNAADKVTASMKVEKQ